MLWNIAPEQFDQLSVGAATILTSLCGVMTILLMLFTF